MLHQLNVIKKLQKVQLDKKKSQNTTKYYETPNTHIVERLSVLK